MMLLLMLDIKYVTSKFENIDEKIDIKVCLNLK